ncbi:MAG: dTDP-4-dehydrorhamnose reductase [Desulfobacterota bacterium]|nr:dTDP-4-dehydrorhamnose reductase [Thermodesulfobacteriota bacterium]
MERIVVIGAKGMLGRDLLPQLHSAFEGEVLGWDLEEIDIRNEKETIEKILEVRPTILLNLAAYTDVDGCEIHREEAFRVNGEGTKHLVLAANRCDAKVVYLSTDYVFDGRKNVPYTEEDEPNPINVYGQSKRVGEEALLRSGKDGLIIRTQWLYGRYGRNFVSAILNQAKERRGKVGAERSLRIVHDQFGNPTYTVDLSRMIVQLIQKGAAGIVHATNQGSCSWFEFGQTILHLCGLRDVEVIPIASDQLDRKALRPAYSVLSTEKLRGEFGIEPRHWREALSDYLSLLKQQGELQWIEG